ncbi:MAG: glutaminase, partial [Oscillospiraceae bacterium]|nr:glutaminase [Oscillospiraceae bacterium]
ADLPFTMQSIAKAFALILALESIGTDALFQRVGAHPSEAPFNSLPAVIDGRCVPANPMLNAGCFVTLDSIPGEEVFPRFEARVRTLCGSGAIAPDEAVCRSEWATCTRNREILAVLQQAGALRRSPGEILELHIRTSALQVTACDLAFFGAVLGSGGLDPRSGRRLVDAGVVRIVCTILFQCGMYNASGPFALSVGLPAKSGVGGGIAAAGPGLGIGVYGPALDGCGNSVGGQKVLEHLSQALKLHRFAL